MAKMEKRKTKLSKILIQFEQITDEKQNIQENIDQIMSQLFSSVEHVKKNNDSMKQKEISDVHKHCIDVLKQLTEFNSILENLVDENPLKTLPCNEQKFITPKSEIVNSEENLTTFSVDNLENNVNPEMEADTLCRNLVTCSKVLSSNRPENSGGIPNIEAQINSSWQQVSQNSSQASILPDTNDVENGEIDIQSIKKSLQEFSEKLGLNLSDMKDYYGKSSTNFPNCSTVLPEIFLPDNLESDIRIFEIPEKDTNANQECSQASSSTAQIVATDSSSEEFIIQDFPYENSSPSGSCNGETDTDIAVAVSLFKEDPAMPKFNSPDLISNVNNNIKNNCTALEKLNNYKSSQDIDNFESMMSPDIKLKPSESVIKNVIYPDGRHRSKKKKDQKRKNEQLTYELKRKEVPKLGQECVMSHVESPAEFYIHVVDDDTMKIDKFNQRIKEYFTTHDCKPEYASKEAALTEIGRFCIAYVEKDKGWYRGEIINGYVTEKHDVVVVQLVDYGNKKLVSYKNLRRMTESMSNLPMLAIRCHFPLFYPPNSTRLNILREWPVSSIEGLLNISGIFSCENKIHFFSIAYLQEEENSIAIDLRAPDLDKEDTTLGQFLLDVDLAVQIIDECDENHMDLEMYLDDVNNLEIHDNINEAIIGYDPRDEARICRFTKSDGTCFKGKNCKLDHVRLSKDGFTTDKELVFREAMYDLILPQPGTRLTILITGYTDTCRFFVQLLNVPQNVGKYMMDREFSYLFEEMNSEKVAKTYESFKVAPALGEIVIVKHWKKWSRGIVRQILMGDNAEEAEAQVFVVDFGEYIKASIKDLKKIKPHFLKLPFQAVECYIHNYEMNKNCSQKLANKFFHKNLYFHNFTAITKSAYPPLKLHLTNQNGLMDVGETLALKGYAVKRAVDDNILDHCPLELF